MATSVEQPTNQHYVDFDEYIDFQLRKTRGNIKTNDVLTAIAGVCCLVLGYLLIFVLLDHWVVPGGFGNVARVIMLSAIAVLAASWTVWRIAVPYFRRINGLYAARAIESAQPELKSNLLNLVDLRNSNRPVSPSILAAIEKRAAVSLAHTNVDEAIDRRHLMHLSYALLAIVLLSCLYALFSPKKISSSIWRALLPAANLNVATRTEILSVDPGDVELIARSQLEVVTDLYGDVPQQVTLYYSTADNRFVDEPVTMQAVAEGVKQYRGTITGENGRGVLQNMTYRIEAGDARSSDYSITVVQPPSAEVDQVHYEFPQYMALDEQTRIGGHIDTWEGATVTVEATANMPIKSAVLHFSDSENTAEKAEEIRMEVVDGTKLRGQWQAGFRSDGTRPHFYRIQCKNDKGETDPHPTFYNITIRPDQPPDVALVDPVSDLEMPANGIVPLVLMARDPDFLLRDVSLRVEKDGELFHSQTLTDSPLGKAAFQTQYDFQLAPLKLKTGETLTFWIEARDNKQPLFNRANTARLNIRIIDAVPEEQAQQKLEEDKQQQQQRLADAEQQNNGENPDVPQPEARSDEEDTAPSDKPANPQENKQTPGEQQDAGQDAEDGTGDASQTPGGSQSQSGKGNSQQPLNKDGEDDVEALRKLLERAQQEKENGQENGKEDSTAKPDDAGKENKQPGNDDRKQNKAQDGTNKADPNQADSQNSDTKNPDPNSDKTSKTDKTNGRPDPTDENPQPNDDPQAKNPQDGKQPDAAQPDGPNPDGNDPQQADKPPNGKQPDTKEPNDKGNTGSPQGAGDQDSPGKPGDQEQKQSPDGKTQESQAEDAGGKTNAKGDQNAKSRPNTPPSPADNNNTTKDGEKTPADKPGDAEQQPGTSDQKGTAKPGDDPNAKTGRANEDLKREEGTKPTTRPGNDPQEQGKENQPNQKKDGATDNPGDAKPAPMTKEGDPQQENPDARPSQGKQQKSQKPPSERSGQPDTGNDDLKGEGRPEGQKSDQPQGGEGGGSKQGDQGNSGSNKPGAGDSSKKPGGAESGKSEGQGKAGDQPGSDAQADGNSKQGGGSDSQKPAQSGSNAKSGEKQSDQQSSDKPGSGEKPAGEKPAGDQANDKQPGGDQGGKKSGGQDKQGGEACGDAGANQGANSDQGGDTPSRATGNNPQGGATTGGQNGDNRGDGGGAGGEAATAEDPNLEYSKQAANLVLKKLKDELDRGEVDQKLLDELGWTADDLKQFSQRMQKRLNDAGNDNSPEAAARRRQFEESLKNLDLQTQGARRVDSGKRKRIIEGVGPRRLPVPVEFRESYEAFTKSVAKQTTRQPASDK